MKSIITPQNYSIPAHTATETADTQAGMVYMVRNIQCFHIESRRWHDIAYNFLVGNDGNVYEGRGWQRIGAHTHGYNSRGIGISFVGCFMNELPAKVAIEACKLLIERFVIREKIVIISIKNLLRITEASRTVTSRKTTNSWHTVNAVQPKVQGGSFLKRSKLGHIGLQIHDLDL